MFIIKTMKKWLKILISTTVVAGVVATASYFSAVAIVDKIKKDNGTKTFVEKIETNDYYHIKHLELEFYDKDTAHNFGLHFSNVFINSHNDSYNFEGNLSVEYDFMEVYSGYSTYINKTFYLETYD